MNKGVPVNEPASEHTALTVKQLQDTVDMLTSRSRAFEADIKAKGAEIVRLHGALLERDQLAEAIKVAAARNGLIDEGNPLDVPALLQMVDELGDCLYNANATGAADQ
jgi:hypothetical protein